MNTTNDMFNCIENSLFIWINILCVSLKSFFIFSISYSWNAQLKRYIYVITLPDFLNNTQQQKQSDMSNEVRDGPHQFDSVRQGHHSEEKGLQMITILYDFYL